MAERKRGLNLLTDTQIRKYKLPNGKTSARLPDGGGLRVLVTKKNGVENKSWVYRYFFPPNTPENSLGFGSYPEISLDEARKRRDKCIQLKVYGKHPKEWNKEIEESIQEYDSKYLFSTLFEKFIKYRQKELAKPTLVRYQGIYKNYLEKDLKDKSILKLTDGDFISVIKKIKSNPVALVSGKTDTQKYDRSVTTKYAKTLVNQVYLYASEWEGYKGENPLTKISKHSLFKQKKATKHKAVKDEDLGKYWYMVKNLKYLQDRIFMQIDIITALRVGSLAQARWSMFDSTKRLLSLPKELMKTKIDFETPLPDLLVKELKELKKITGTKDEDYIFTNSKGEHYSKDRPRKIIKEVIGLDYATAHGNRTILKVNASRFSKISNFAIEYQLSHEYATKDEVEDSYMGDYDWLVERRDLVDWFTEYLDGLEEIYINSMSVLEKVRSGNVRINQSAN